MCNVTCQNLLSWQQHLLASKHQKKLSVMGARQEEAERGIFITRVPRGCSQLAVLDHFAKFGPVSDIFVGKSFFILHFKERKSAQAALQNQSHFLLGQRIIVREQKIRNTGGQQRSKDSEEISVTDLMKSTACFKHLPDMIQCLMKQLSLTETDIQHRDQACWDLYRLLSELSPNCTVHPFGSSVNGLGFHGTDLDVYCELPFDSYVATESKKVKLVANVLCRAPSIITKVVRIPRARVPLVKCLYLKHGINCDITFKNRISLQNSHLILFFVNFDSRFKSLMFVVRYWAKLRGLTGGSDRWLTMSNYAVCMLVICYLQQLELPILPTVCELQENSADMLIDGWNTAFCEDQLIMQCIKRYDTETTIDHLIHNFFKFYSTFDFKHNIVSPYIGSCQVQKAWFSCQTHKIPQVFTRYLTMLEDDSKTPLPVDSPACLQDPFELNVNVLRAFSSPSLLKFQKFCTRAVTVTQKWLSLSSKELHRAFEELFIPETYAEVEKSLQKVEKREILIMFNKNFKPPEESLSHLADGSRDNNERVTRDLWFFTIPALIKQILQYGLMFECSDVIGDSSNAAEIEESTETGVDDNRKVEEKSATDRESEIDEFETVESKVDGIKTAISAHIPELSSLSGRSSKRPAENIIVKSHSKLQRLSNDEDKVVQPSTDKTAGTEILLQNTPEEGTSEKDPKSNEDCYFVLKCSSYYRTWEDRKKIHTALAFPSDISPLDREHLISDVLVNNTEGKPNLPIVMFDMKFYKKEDPVSVKLVIVNKHKNVRLFKHLFKNLLDNWLKNMISEVQHLSCA